MLPSKYGTPDLRMNFQQKGNRHYIGTAVATVKR